MPHERNSEFTSIEHENFKLAYENDFAEIFANNREIAKKAIALAEQAEEEYAPPNLKLGDSIEAQWNKNTESWEAIKMWNQKLQLPSRLEYGRGAFMIPGKTLRDEGADLEVTALGRFTRTLSLRYSNRKDRTSYLKMKLKGQEYFLKRSTVTNNPGFTEFHNAHTATEKLKDLDFVTVVKAKLGFQTESESWYVAKWTDLESAGYNSMGNMENFNYNDYGDRIPVGFISEKEFEEAFSKMEQIWKILKVDNIHDDVPYNLFYNPETKHFILLDVAGYDQDKMLGEPFKN